MHGPYIRRFWKTGPEPLGDLLPEARRALFADEFREPATPQEALACDAADGEQSRAWLDDALHPQGATCGVFLPERYEPRYAYPLLIWLADDGRADALHRVMPQISTQNYVGLSLPIAVDEDVDQAADHVEQAVRELRQRCHLHTERVFAAGFGRGACAALSLLLARPEWLAGALALCGGLPDRRGRLVRFRELRGKPVLLTGGAGDPTWPVAALVETGRLLHGAGLSVTTRVYDTAREATPRMLRDLDDWMMQHVCLTAA